MILYRVGKQIHYECRSDKPSSDWTGRAEYVLDERDARQRELIKKIKAYAPFVSLVYEGGVIVDAADDTEARALWEADQPKVPTHEVRGETDGGLSLEERVSALEKAVEMLRKDRGDGGRK